MIKLTNEPIDTAEIINYVQAEGAGAVDIFLGTVRNATSGKHVKRLEYEVYEAMALKEMEKIGEKVKEKWPVQQLAMVHRTGILHIGDVAVIVAVSTPHRNDAFEACRYGIDEIKSKVTIWKKEVFEDGETWVAAHG